MGDLYGMKTGKIIRWKRYWALTTFPGGQRKVVDKTRVFSD